MKKVIILVTLLLCTGYAAANPDPNFYIFLCFGQSNMDGAGQIESQDQTVNDRFQMMATMNDSKLDREKGRWYPAVPPLCRPTGGLGPADYFGRTLVANLPEKVRVGVINVAVPGCKIELFEKDTFRAYAATAPDWMTNFINEYEGNPYQTLVDLAWLAQQEGVIKGILLHQGESNANDHQWPNKIKGVYENLLKDLNLKAQDVPLLAGETVHADQEGVCAGMNEIIARLPEVIPSAHVISSAGCTHKGDRLHFNSAGYREFGNRYAQTLLAWFKTQSESDTPTKPYVHHGAGNPYLPLWEHLPDGEPRVFEDPDNPGKYRIYIIGSHDVTVRGYCGPDIRAWSAPVEDLSSWRDEGPIFTYKVGDRWDTMFAPDLVEVQRKNGKKEYYLYPHSRGRNREAMVAKGDRPDGPFNPINMTEDGSRTVPGSTMGFDPAVYIDYITDKNDPDYEIGFRAYGYWGFQRSSAGQLDQNTLYSLRPGTEAIGNFINTRAFPGEDPAAFSFFEAASIRKIGNKFVWAYSGHSGPDYGLGRSNATLRYAYGDSPLGPWKSGGVLVDARAVVLNKDGTKLSTSYSGHNTHGSIQLINDQYYVFYHRAPRGFGNARQPMVAPIKVVWDDKPVSEGGKVTIRGYDPYAEDNIWTAKASQGVEYTGAEVTSEGFHIYGLDPYRYYSAGYACYLSNQQSQQDSWDMWDNNMPITGIKNGHIIGYKYFGFEGLDKDKKGLKAFDGTKPGNKTAFNLFLTPKTTTAFKVNVWLDGPWDNDTWKGKKIGEITVPANATQEITKFSVDVASSVDNLGGKHAVFLVAEGFGSVDLCDLSGLGFSSNKTKIVRPVPPTVSIQVNGQAIELPDTPVRFTSTNGITSVDLYEATQPLPANTTEIPHESASASDRTVKVAVTQADTVDGTAVVKFDYNGVVKTYHTVFSVE